MAQQIGNFEGGLQMWKIFLKNSIALGEIAYISKCPFVSKNSKKMEEISKIKSW